ncbi:hypothetical protein FGADI_5523 [Fusarium gaditjirri]|uniref:Uncharacterized protein n=1 Tax=Fusarium gaditjirri TaxID=282569 RepID=A0A8H4TA73_9HYPO|nr:hypothetical protein FGADI_5523 [Fusarium gaditjirri]
MWRLEDQGDPHRPVCPGMFESRDYLRFGLEHPRHLAFARVSAEDDLAKTRAAVKPEGVEPRDSTSEKKCVASIRFNGLGNVGSPPRKIKNPDYFDDKAPANFEPMGGIGFEMGSQRVLNHGQVRSTIDTALYIVESMNVIVKRN